MAKMWGVCMSLSPVNKNYPQTDTLGSIYRFLALTHLLCIIANKIQMVGRLPKINVNSILFYFSNIEICNYPHIQRQNY